LKLSHSERRFLMYYFASPCHLAASIRITDKLGRDMPKRNWFQKRKSSRSVSAIIAVNLALRGYFDLFAELVGLAPPIVMSELLPRCGPPFFGGAQVAKFVHTVAHSIAHQHSETVDRAQISTLASDIVAAVLKLTESVHSEKGIDTLNSVTSESMTVLADGKDSRDAGTEIALLACGARKYLSTGRDRQNRKYARSKFVIDLGLGALGPIPVDGGATGTAQTTINGIWKLCAKHKLQKWSDLESHLEFTLSNAVSSVLNFLFVYSVIRE